MKHARYLLLALLVGCASTRVAPQEDRVAVDSYSLLGEIALEGERREEAARYFLEAASASDDVLLAERATRLAYESSLNDIGLTAVARWLELAPDDGRAHWFAGSFETRAGRLPQAIRHFTTFIAAAEERGDVAGGLGLAIEALNAEPDTAAATTVMVALTDAYPGTPEGHFGLARLAMRSGDFALALDNARAAAELRPEWIDAQLLYARTLLVSGRSEESLALGAKLAEDYDDLEVQLQYAELLLSAGRASEAESRLEAILADNPGLPEATRALAFLSLAENEMDEARRLFDELRYDARYRDEAFYYLGRIAETEEEPLQATRSYARVTGGSHAVEAQIRSAAILLAQTNDPNSALRHLEDFGEANPRFRSEMLVARGQLLVQVDRSAEAMELFDAALETSPTDATLHDAQAQLYVYLVNEASGRGDLEEAERLVDTGLDRYPQNVSLRYSQALLLQQQGEMRRSVRVLEALVAEHPENAALLNALGYLLTDQFDRHREARTYIQKALAMDPDNPAIIDSMGWVLFKLGEYESALDYLDRAYRLEPDPEIAAHLVDVQWALGNREQALELLQTALEDNPDSDHLNDVDRRLNR
jgi:tetratricopeptide (TPR) repeat protein